MAEVLTDFPLDREYDVNWTDCYFLILPDMAAFQELDQAQFAAYTAADSYPSAPTYEMGFNFEMCIRDRDSRLLSTGFHPRLQRSTWACLSGR